MENYNQSWRNRQSNNQGAQLESLILGGCEYYRIKGIAEIEKTPEPFRVTKKFKDGTFYGRFGKKAQPDFQGTMSDGRSIVFEAKSTMKDRIQQNILTKEQMRCLESHYNKGAHAAVMVQVRKTYAMVPWEIWRNMKTLYKRKYMLESELEKYKVLLSSRIRFLEYIDKGEEASF